MKLFTIAPDHPEPSTLETVAGILRRGGIVAFATDTLYGLAVDPRRDEVVSKLIAAKGRDERAPIPLIAANLEQAQEAGTFGPIEFRLAREFWPGPLTLVVPAEATVARRILAGGTTVGIRVPAHPVARELCRAVGHCLTATSANISGNPAAASVSEIDSELASRIDAVLDSGPAPGGPASTIVAASAEGLRLLRAGAIEWSRVLKSLG